MKKLISRYPAPASAALMFIWFCALMILRDFSPGNELRYLSIADEMLSGGKFFALYNHGIAYADKPPLYFWLIALCKIIFGKHCMFALSMLSFVPACVTILIMDKWLVMSRPDVSPESRFTAGLMLSSTALFLGAAVFVRMDMLMTMFIVLALYSFLKDRPTAFAVFTFLALFTKGPVGLLMPLLSVLASLLVEKKPLRRWFGLRTWLIIGIGCAVWFTGAYIDGGWEYMENLLVHQTAGRAINSFHHSEPLWYYLVVIWGFMAPWAFVAIPSFVGLIRRRKQLQATGDVLISCSMSVTFVMLSCFSSKLGIYLLPITPLIIYCTPMLMAADGCKRWMRIVNAVTSGILAIFWLAALIVLLSGAEFLDLSNYDFLGSPWAVVTAAVAFLCSLAGLILCRSWNKSVVALALSILLLCPVGFPMIPQINNYVGYRNICLEIPAQADVYSWNCFRPENLDVYLGRDVAILDESCNALEDAVNEVLKNQNAVLLVRTRDLEGLENVSDSLIRIDKGRYTLLMRE